MKTLIFGAGPIGSFFAQKLWQAGHDVTILARGKRLRDIREHGVVIENSSTGEQTVSPVPVVEKLAEDDYYDLIIVAMRKNQAVEILPVLAKNRKVPTILFMMNNAEGQERLIKSLGKERIMIGFPVAGGYRDGHIVRVFPVDEKNRATIPLGEVDGSITERTRQVAKVIGSMGGYRIQIRRDMDEWLKVHVAFLMPAAVPSLYAAGTDLKRWVETRDALVLAARGIKEGLRVLRKNGITVLPWSLAEWVPEPLMIVLFRWLARKEAMEVSGIGHARAARDEMKYLADEFLSLARETDVPTPAIDELYPYFDSHTPSCLMARVKYHLTGVVYGV